MQWGLILKASAEQVRGTRVEALETLLTGLSMNVSCDCTQQEVGSRKELIVTKDKDIKCGFLGQRT
jgi:hypothetical protein